MKTKTVRPPQNGQLKTGDQNPSAKAKGQKCYRADLSYSQLEEDYRPQVLTSSLERNINFLNKYILL